MFRLLGGRTDLKTHLVAGFGTPFAIAGKLSMALMSGFRFLTIRLSSLANLQDRINCPSHICATEVWTTLWRTLGIGRRSCWDIMYKVRE